MDPGNRSLFFIRAGAERIYHRAGNLKSCDSGRQGGWKPDLTGNQSGGKSSGCKYIFYDPGVSVGGVYILNRGCCDSGNTFGYRQRGKYLPETDYGVCGRYDTESHKTSRNGALYQ